MIRIPWRRPQHPHECDVHAEYSPDRPQMHADRHHLTLDTSVLCAIRPYGCSFDLVLDREYIGIIRFVGTFVYAEGLHPNALVRVYAEKRFVGILFLTEGVGHTVLFGETFRPTQPYQCQFHYDLSFSHPVLWKDYTPDAVLTPNAEYLQLTGPFTHVNRDLMMWFHDRCVGFITHTTTACIERDFHSGMFRCTSGTLLVGWIVLWDGRIIDYVLLNGCERENLQVDPILIQWNEVSEQTQSVGKKRHPHSDPRLPAADATIR